MNPRHLNEIKGIILIACSILVFLAIISYTPQDIFFLAYPANNPVRNLISVFGAWLSFGLILIIGWVSYALPVILFSWGMTKFRSGPFFEKFRFAGIILLIFSLSAFAGMTSSDQTLSFWRGGLMGFVFAEFLYNYFGAGAWVIVSALILLSSVLVMEFMVSNFVVNTIDRLKLEVKMPKIGFPGLKKEKKKELKFGSVVEKQAQITRQAPQIKAQSPACRIDVRVKAEEKESNHVPKPQSVQIKSGTYQLPSLDLLDEVSGNGARKVLEEDMTGNAHILEDTLADFGISVRVTNIERGPVITRYELEPAPGVKVGRIVSLSDDIALAMKAQSVRIVAPIPGKSRVGIEAPNTSIGTVGIKEILSSPEFQTASSKLTLSLGKDITGKPVVSDLGEMPHLLIAGTTGSGKTVCVNALILSMLYRATPEEIKFIMVDPKMVEMSMYNGLPHLICPVVTDAKKVQAALAWVVEEMEERYKLLAKTGSRNIEIYNQKQEKFPYIVVVIDELADLMAIAANQIETAITRLAQLSRAVGIHLILATQRPSVDVITGVIKANFPARISFKVASKVDSRTVLDANGADKLLGKGDMLFMRPGESKLIRAQGALLKDNEIERVVNFIKNQAEPVYEENILTESVKPQGSLNLADREKDELFNEAVRLILESNQASVSILQRRLMLGYTRAARLIDTMEQEGIVGPYQGSKPRKIMVDRKLWLKEHGFTPSRLEGEESAEEVKSG